MTRMRLRHYGSPEYEADCFAPVKDRGWVKPYGGLWASPVDSIYGWREWCAAESFGDLTHFFDFDLEGRVLVIDGADDLSKMTWTPMFPGGSLCSPAFESMLSQGVDAIHLTVNGQNETRLTLPCNLYGWDMECVLVMNPRAIRA